MADFSQEVRGQLATINATVNTLQEQLESLAGEVARNHRKISQVSKHVKTVEVVSQNTSLQLASQISTGLNQLTANQQTVNLTHNRILAQITALHINPQQQCRQTSLEALQDSLAAHTSQLASATEQLSTGRQALEDGLTEQLQTVSSDCDNRTAELLQGQQTVLERLHGIEEKLEHMHTCNNHTNHSALEVCCNNETKQTEYRSCGDANLLGLPSGTYTIRPSGGSPVTVYCDMDNEECGGGAWMKVASYNYSDPSTACPGDWNLITSPVRSCGRSSPSGSCASAVFPTNSIEFSSVCGRVITIQFGSPSAFYQYHRQSQKSIDDYYVDGVSITYGNPRQHVWTFVAYPSDHRTYSWDLCPCSQPSLNVPSPPPFVGKNYFCDTAAPTCCHTRYYPDDPLWDAVADLAMVPRVPWNPPFLRTT